MKTFTYVVIGVVVAAVLVGFYVAGSPFSNRLQRFDDRRAQDLQTIQWEVINYWQSKAKLPDALDALNDDIRGFRVPSDPQTSSAYEYQKTGDVSFRLCANFVTEGDSASTTAYKPVMPYGVNETWQHGKGRTCFDRTIDKDLYPPKPR